MKIKYNDIEIIRQINTVMVLNVLRKSDRLLTRPNMADQLGLSKVTIANIIHDLTFLGFTTDAGLGTTDRRGGRKPGLVSLDRDKKRIMGACLTHRMAELVLSDITGRELKRLRAKIGPQDGPEILADMALDALDQSETPRSSVLGLVAALGSGHCGLDLDRGPAAEVPRPSSPAQELGRALGEVPVCLVSFSRARAFGECWFNHDFQSPAHFFYVNLGHELTCLAARRGLLDESSSEFPACAMSFLPRDSDDHEDRQATVASALSGRNFLRQASVTAGRSLSAREAAQLAAEGDRNVLEHFRRFGYSLGCALSMVVNMDGFQKIIVGGILAESWPYFQSTMDQGLERHLARRYRGGAVEVKPLHPDLSSGLLGAQALALDRWVYHTELLHGGR